MAQLTPDAQSNYSAPDAGGDHSTTTGADDGSVSGHGNRGDSLPTARRPLTGERVEPVARRMRTNGPPQRDEPRTACTTRWGLGARNANKRWNICDQYITENGTEGARDGLLNALIRGGCPDNIAEMTIQTWLQAGLLIHNGEHVRAGAMDVHGNLRALQPPERHEDHPPAGTNVALLSLFDGTRLARIAVDEAIQDCGDIMMVRSAFVEHDTTLA